MKVRNRPVFFSDDHVQFITCTYILNLVAHLAFNQSVHFCTVNKLSCHSMRVGTSNTISDSFLLDLQWYKTPRVSHSSSNGFRNL